MKNAAFESESDVHASQSLFHLESMKIALSLLKTEEKLNWPSIRLSLEDLTYGFFELDSGLVSQEPFLVKGQMESWSDQKLFEHKLQMVNQFKNVLAYSSVACVPKTSII